MVEAVLKNQNGLQKTKTVVTRLAELSLYWSQKGCWPWALRMHCSRRKTVSSKMSI